MRSSIITLTTDLGTSDAYTGTLKGALLSSDTSLNLIDISHAINPRDVMAGGWVLKQAYSSFPQKTVHIAAVGVGSVSSQHCLVIDYNNHFFVCPDNGLFSLVQKSGELAKIYKVSPSSPTSISSPTDLISQLMVPSAAAIVSGSGLAELGELTTEIVRYKWAEPFCDRNGIQGMIHHIDHYGNLISNIDVQLFDEKIGSQTFKMYIGNTIIRQLENYPARVEDQECFTFKGSSGMMEIGVKGGNAAELLSVQKGAAVSVVLS
jgi:S-adenosylmethionine hydrolase